MTPQQEALMRKEAKRRGYNPQQVEAFVQFAKGKELGAQQAQQQPQQPAQPQEKKQNPITGLIKSIAQPVARVGASIYNVGSGINKAVQGDIQGANQELSKTRNIAGIQAKPLELKPNEQSKGVAGYLPTGQSAADVAGVAAELAPYGMGAGAIKGGLSLFKSQFAKAVLKGSATGAASGALFGAGRAAQADDASLGSVAREGLKGGAAGAAAGAVVGAAGAGVQRLIKHSQTPPTARPAAGDSFIARTQRRIQDAIQSRNELKAQPLAVQRAAKVDIAPETSRFVLGMSKPDKVLAKTMLNMAKRGKDTLKPTSRPVEVPGRIILEPVNFIQNTRKTAGVNLGNIVKEMKPKPFVAENSVKTFTDGLQDLGIGIGKGGKLSFTNSSITNATEQGLLQRIARDLKLGTQYAGRMNPIQDHRMRQRIFGMLKTAKVKGELTYGQTVAERTRTALKDDLVAATGSQGQRYAAEAQKYAQAEDILKDFFSLMGKKWEDKADDVLQLRAGEVGSRILGNASAAPMELLNRLQATAQSLGYKPKNNPVDLLIFNDLLEDLIGTTQTRSLRGQVSRGVRDATGNMAGMAEDALSGNKLGVVKKAVDFVRGITPEEQLRELLRLLD